MGTAQYANPAGYFNSSSSHTIIEDDYWKRTIRCTYESGFTNFKAYRVTMYRPTQSAPNITRFDWRFELIDGDYSGRKNFEHVYNGFLGQARAQREDIVAPGIYTGTFEAANTYSDSATDPAWYCSIGAGDPSASNSIGYVSFQHDANSGAGDRARVEHVLSTCEPIPESIHVYLNGIEQYEPIDWELMPPDANHSNKWWIKSEDAMEALVNDLVEVRYVCKPGGAY